jgi:hypothetical protein
VRTGRPACHLAVASVAPPATTLIGITFVVMLLLVGSWAYTDVLVELARGMAGSVGARSLLLLAPLARRGRSAAGPRALRSTRIAAAQVPALLRRRRAHGLGEPASFPAATTA